MENTTQRSSAKTAKAIVMVAGLLALGAGLASCSDEQETTTTTSEPTTTTVDTLNEVAESVDYSEQLAEIEAAGNVLDEYFMSDDADPECKSINDKLDAAATLPSEAELGELEKCLRGTGQDAVVEAFEKVTELNKELQPSTN